MCAICETFFRKNKQLLRGNMWNNYDTKVKKSNKHMIGISIEDGVQVFGNNAKWILFILYLIN